MGFHESSLRRRSSGPRRQPRSGGDRRRGLSSGILRGGPSHHGPGHAGPDSRLYLLKVEKSVRGYEGAAGNVLVDGQRPAAKTDTLDAILRRIPTSSVSHIEIIRGGASGVDMQGRSVLANVVLKKEAPASISGQFSCDLSDQLWHDRAPGAHCRVRAERRAKVAIQSASGGKYIDGSYGDGPTLRTDANGLPVQTGFSQSKAVGQNYQVTGAYELPIGEGRLKLNGLLQRAPYDDDISNRTLDSQGVTGAGACQQRC